MRIQIHVDRDAALRAGHDVSGSVVVEVAADELAPRYRELLIAHGTRLRGVDADYCLSYWVERQGAPFRLQPGKVAKGTQSAVLEVLDEIERVLEKERQEDERRREVAREWAALSVEERLKRPAPAGAERYERAAWIEAVGARRAAEEAERRAEEERRRDEAEARVARLAEWARAEGSEQVRLLLEEGHQAWTALAEQEFVKGSAPGGTRSLQKGERVRELDVPRSEDVVALRRMREEVARSGGVLEGERLVEVSRLAMAESEEEEALAGADGSFVVEVWRAVAVRVVPPTLNPVEVYREVR